MSATFTSLPREILIRIASLADRNSYLSLLRVSHHFLSLGDGPLWAHLGLTLPPRFGALPLILPYEQPDEPSTGDDEGGPYVDPDDPYYRWANGEEERSAERYRRGLLDKVKEIIRVGDRRNWGLVKAVTMTPQPNSIHLMMLILEYVHLNLQHLHVEATTKLPFAATRHADHFPTFLFDASSAAFPPSFSHLTNLEITRLPVTTCDLCLHFCTLCPNLTSLNLDFLPSDLQTADYTKVQPPISGFETKLDRLRLSLGHQAQWEGLPPAELFLILLEHSPGLERVIFASGEYSGEAMHDAIWNVLVNHPTLQDLRWTGDEEPFGSPGIRRLVVQTTNFEDALYLYQDFPLLHTLYLFCPLSAYSVSYECGATPDPLPCPLSIPSFAQAIRSLPSLRTFQELPAAIQDDAMDLFDYLDQLEQSNPLSAGQVSSICHAGGEVIQLKIPREWVHVADLERDASEDHYPSPEYIIFPYEMGPETSLGKDVFQRRAIPVISRYADYQGKAVPPAIIRKMKEVAGDRVENWDRRGVVVDKDVWEVLEDWYKQLPSSAEESAA